MVGVSLTRVFGLPCSSTVRAASSGTNRASISVTCLSENGLLSNREAGVEIDVMLSFWCTGQTDVLRAERAGISAGGERTARPVEDLQVRPLDKALQSGLVVPVPHGCAKTHMHTQYITTALLMHCPLICMHLLGPPPARLSFKECLNQSRARCESAGHAFVDVTLQAGSHGRICFILHSKGY